MRLDGIPDSSGKALCAGAHLSLSLVESFEHGAALIPTLPTRGVGTTVAVKARLWRDPIGMRLARKIAWPRIS